MFGDREFRLLARGGQPDADERLRFVLDQIVQHLSTDIICVYRCRDLGSHKEISVLAYDGAPPDLEGAHPDNVRATLTKMVSHLYTNGVENRSVVALQASIFQNLSTALIWPVDILGSFSGGVVFFSATERTFPSHELDQVQPWVIMAHTLIENNLLSERLMISEAVAETAQAIARNPSPENIITVMRDHLFDEHVSSCMICIYGPFRQNHPFGPFDYAEIKGVWSRKYGTARGLGNRYSMDQAQNLASRLNDEKILTFSDTETIADYALDSFLQDVFQPENAQSLALLSLESEYRVLGFIILTSSKPFHFSPQLLYTYRLVAEFLTMSTLAETMRQQANFVQQGRSALLDTMRDSVIMVLPDAEQHVLTINQQFTRSFTLGLEEVQGLPLNTLLDTMSLPANIRRDLQEQWLAFDAEHTSESHGEFRLMTVNGVQSDIEWYTGPVYDGEQVLGYIYILRDITAERTAERLRYELLSRISHELRTPLTAISGFAEFVLEDEELPSQAREYVEIIHQSAQHLADVFTDIIEITRANAGEVRLYLSEVHLPHMVQEILTRLQPASQERQLQIVVELDDNLPKLHVDIDRISRVLINLIDNAIKFSPEAGTVTLQLQHIFLAKHLPPSAPSDVTTPCVIFSIIDQGKGVIAEDVEKIFLPLYRADRARKEQVDGTGLGLAICRSLVELHRGKVWGQPATRQEPGGRFFVTLPTADGKNAD